MLSISSPRFLRHVLRVDAVSCLACGVLQFAFTGQMATLLNLPHDLLLYTGEFLLLYGLAVGVLSALRDMPRGLVWCLVAANLAWAVACVVLLLSGQVQASAMGVAYVLVQALTVAVLAELQFFGLRRAPVEVAW
ncbi:MAG: hypothetical protein V4772_00340 [Pseudomonadota bacterium]